MGRKAKFDEKAVKKGGKKRNKKHDEIAFGTDLDKKPGKTSHRQSQRAKKRLIKKKEKEEIKKAKKIKKVQDNPFSEPKFDCHIQDDNVSSVSKKRSSTEESSLQPLPKKSKKIEKELPKLNLFKDSLELKPKSSKNGNKKLESKITKKKVLSKASDVQEKNIVSIKNIRAVTRHYK